MARDGAARAAIDLSDGLADAVRQLAEASGLGARIDADLVPLLDRRAAAGSTARPRAGAGAGPGQRRLRAAGRRCRRAARAGCARARAARHTAHPHRRAHRGAGAACCAATASTRRCPTASTTSRAPDAGCHARCGGCSWSTVAALLVLAVFVDPHARLDRRRLRRRRPAAARHRAALRGDRLLQGRRRPPPAPRCAPAWPPPTRRCCRSAASSASTRRSSRYSGIWTVLDTGPEVKGRELDLYMWSCNDALAFGRRAVRVTILRLGWDPRHSAPGAGRAAVPPPRARARPVDAAPDAARRRHRRPPRQCTAPTASVDRRAPAVRHAPPPRDVTRVQHVRDACQRRRRMQRPEIARWNRASAFAIIPALCTRCTSFCRPCASWPSPIATTARSSRRASGCSTTRGQTPAHTKYDGANFYPTSQVGAVRPPLRRHHRRRSAGRPDAGGAVRLGPRASSGWSPACAWPAPCTTAMILWASTRRGGQVAGRARARSRSARSPAPSASSPSCSSLDRRAGRPRHRRGQRAAPTARGAPSPSP